ncbi:hypothetical protein L0F63_005491 [Massospora cicadina]|nr:hypothetical protein L0F63_005491 [Massospora cicadina]
MEPPSQLHPGVLRSLADKLYDKRKAAALEIKRGYADRWELDMNFGSSFGLRKVVNLETLWWLVKIDEAQVFVEPIFLNFHALSGYSGFKLTAVALSKSCSLPYLWGGVDLYSLYTLPSFTFGSERVTSQAECLSFNVRCGEGKAELVVKELTVGLVRDLYLQQEHEVIRNITSYLVREFVFAHFPHAKNGGLIGLAAVAIALGSEVDAFLDDIIPPVLACFNDQDAKVRYYACEAMYNITKVARGDVMRFFNETFDALSKLASDTDPSAKSGSELLNRLMKDIISELSTDTLPSQTLSQDVMDDGTEAPPSRQFSLASFIPLLTERVKTVNPFTRTFLVGWISVLNSIPDLELVTYLPDFMEGLLKFLADSNPDVATATRVLFSDFLRDIRDAARASLTQEPPEIDSTASGPTAGTSQGIWIAGQGVRVDYGKILELLLPHMASQDDGDGALQALALRWANDFALFAKPVVLEFAGRLVSAMLPCLAHAREEIGVVAAELNSNLYQLVYCGEADYVAMAHLLLLQLLNDHEVTRVESLAWLIMLHSKAPDQLFRPGDGMFPALLRVLSDPSEEVVKRDLQLLAQISTHADDSKPGPHFVSFMVDLLSLFSTDRRLLEHRGALIVRQLCVSLHSETIYRSLASILESDKDLEFAQMMVQHLNLLLITAPELQDLRRKLKRLNSREGQALFVALYRSWCHSPVATFSLCLLAQAYEPAATLLQTFAELEITVAMLIQVDKLVQLLESPIFTYLRLQLLEPDKHPFLFKCLYGLLMLLPQSSAFATLKNRLGCINANGYLLAPTPQRSSDPAKRPKADKDQGAVPPLKFNELLAHFKAVQASHERARRTASLPSTRRPPEGPAPSEDEAGSGLTQGSPSSRRPSLPKPLSRSSRRVESPLSHLRQQAGASNPNLPSSNNKS